MIPTKLQTLIAFCRSKSGFTCIQGAILVLVLVTAGRCALSANSRPRMPRFTDRPRQVRPQYDYPFVVSDQQLADVLSKMHPKFIQQPTKVNFVDHAIRMWGFDAKFQDESIDGRQMLNLLLNHDAFAAVWGGTVPLLRPTINGISVTTQQGRSSVSHIDHLIGTLAEIGVPLSCPVQTRQGRADVRKVLENALMNFRINQREYEWTALAAAFYVTNGAEWYSTEGQAIDFNLLASRLMRQPQPEGVCYGQHRLYSMTMLLRIDDQMNQEGSHTLLDTKNREQVLDYLLGMTQRLYHTQADKGYWDGNWPDLDNPIPDPTTHELSRRILATGHVLEWWAMAPTELHPPRATIVNAAQWLATEITLMDPVKVEKNFTFLTHAARALALWRGCFPDEFERQIESGKRSVRTNSGVTEQTAKRNDPTTNRQ